MQQHEGEQQTEWNRERNNYCGANINQEEDEPDQNQDHAAQKIGFHCTGGKRDEVAAIVKRTNLHVLGKNGIVQNVGLLFDALEYFLGLLAATHQDHAFHGVVVFLKSEFAEAGSVANHHFAYIFHPNWNALVAAYDYVADIALVAQQAKSANVEELPTLGIESTARVRIIGGQSIDYLRNREVISVQPGRIHQHLVLHGFAAQAGIVGHAGNRFVSALQRPIFDDLQLLSAAIGTLEYI